MTRRLALLAALLVLAACGGSSNEAEPASATTSIAGPPFDVAGVTETFVDASRATPAGSETPARPDRTVVTRIAYPTTGGPYPLLVMSHGFTGHPDEYTETVKAWAAEGFVVATPAFPLTNWEVPGVRGNLNDFPNQPGDVSFVIDEVLAAGADPASPLHDVVDAEAIGVVGHSLGGATTWAVSFHTATRDPRIDSVVVFAGLTLTIEGGELAFDSSLPLLVMHGDADDVPIDSSKAAYEQAMPPKWFVTLHGADHRTAFTDDPSPYDELVTRTLIDFWRGTLDGDRDALARVTASASDPALSTVEHQ